MLFLVLVNTSEYLPEWQRKVCRAPWPLPAARALLSFLVTRQEGEAGGQGMVDLEIGLMLAWSTREQKWQTQEIKVGR
jgi:hypothetical protein